MIERSAERGFTLVEVLVAFAILALALGFLMHVIGNVLDRTSVADLRVGAAALGRSLLDRVGHDLPLEDGVREGDDGRYRWRVTILPYGDQQDRDAWPVAAHSVAVAVGWGTRGETISLDTLKLGPKPVGP